jgi:hypothetical protein
MVKYILTSGGRRVWPLNMCVDDIDIEEIAHALSNICRFTGHSRFHYSVAQHCVYVAQAVSSPNRLWGLLHDAAEAYINDIASPVKNQNRFKFYRDLEKDILLKVSKRFDIPREIPKEVVEVDHNIVHDEGIILFDAWCVPDNHIVKRHWIEEITPKLAERMFMEVYESLAREKEETLWK